MLRIKLPPKPNESEYTPEPSLGRRRKRPFTVNSDEEVDYADSGHPDDIPREAGNSDPESEGTNEPEPHQPKSRQGHSSDSRQKRGKRKAILDEPPPPKRKRAVSELDSDDEYAIDEDTAGAGMEDDGDLEADHKRQPKKARTKMPVKPMKGQGVDSATTDGRKTSPAKASTEPSEPRSITGSKRSRAKPSRPEDTGDTVSSPNISTRSPSPPRETSPPPPTKKRKLPPIKKNKPAGATGPSTPSGSSAPNKPAPVAGAGHSKQGLPEVSKPAAVRKTPATAGNADFDLRNESVYRELFKTTGGSTPRSGLSRREKDEERRKELNKLREEAKAKRLLETGESFDLQGQFETISRFEERLKQNRSSALYPNFLAGKWRELWERERRHKEKEWHDNQDGVAGKEEGEMFDN